MFAPDTDVNLHPWPFKYSDHHVYTHNRPIAHIYRDTFGYNDTHGAGCSNSDLYRHGYGNRNPDGVAY